MNTTIPAMVLRNASRFTSRTVMREKREGHYQDLSWNELRDSIFSHARSLLALGFKPGERIAIMAPNGPEWAYADLGIMAIGGTSVPIYHTEGVDTLVIAQGHRQNTALEEEIHDLGVEIHMVGDCLSPRSAEEAVYEGLIAARQL